LPLFLYDVLFHLENFTLALVMVLQYYFQGYMRLSYWFPLVQLLINVICFSIQRLVIDNKGRHQSRKINNKKTLRFSHNMKPKGYKLVEWENLKPGDIIKVKDGQELPVDVLILETSDPEHKCYTRGGFGQDDQITNIKHSCEGTINKARKQLTPSQFVEQIHGVIKYEYNHQGYFSGSLKFHNNPAAFNLKVQNIALRGSRIDNTNVVQALVLNIGDDCLGQFTKMHKRFGYLSQKSFSRIYLPLRYFNYALLIFATLVTALSLIQLLLQANFGEVKFMNLVVDTP